MISNILKTISPAIILTTSCRNTQPVRHNSANSLTHRQVTDFAKVSLHQKYKSYQHTQPEIRAANLKIEDALDQKHTLLTYFNTPDLIAMNDNLGLIPQIDTCRLVFLYELEDVEVSSTRARQPGINAKA